MCLFWGCVTGKHWKNCWSDSHGFMRNLAWQDMKTCLKTQCWLSAGRSLLFSPTGAWYFIFRKRGIFKKSVINQGTKCNWNTNYSCLFRYQYFCYSISCLSTFVTVDFKSILIQLSRICPKITWYLHERKWVMQT